MQGAGRWVTAEKVENGRPRPLSTLSPCSPCSRQRAVCVLGSLGFCGDLGWHPHTPAPSSHRIPALRPEGKVEPPGPHPACQGWVLSWAPWAGLPGTSPSRPLQDSRRSCPCSPWLTWGRPPTPVARGSSHIYLCRQPTRVPSGKVSVHAESLQSCLTLQSHGL